MLVKYSIAEYPLLKQALKPLTDLAYKTIQEYVNGEKAHMLSEKALKERALYNVPVAVLHGAFKARYANSQETAYINLKNDINIAVSTLFNNHSVSVAKTVKGGKKVYEIKSAFEVDAKNAIKPYIKTVRRIYERRIERAILKNKSSINLISNKTLLHYFNLSFRKITNKEVVQDVASTIHSIYYHLQSSGIDVNKLTNNYAENKQLLLSFWYDCKIKSFDVTDNLIVKDNGIYRKKKDGTVKCSCRFHSHVFNGEYFSDSFYFAVNEKNDAVLNVLQYRSLYEVLFSIANKCIDENRRSYTSTKKEVQEKDGSTKELDITDCFSYDEKGYINTENNKTQYLHIIKKAIQKDNKGNKGLKRDLLIPFVNAIWLVKAESLSQDVACKIVGIDRKTFYRNWKKYEKAICKAIDLYNKTGKEAERKEPVKPPVKREVMQITIDKSAFNKPTKIIACVPDISDNALNRLDHEKEQAAKEQAETERERGAERKRLYAEMLEQKKELAKIYNEEYFANAKNGGGKVTSRIIK